MSPSHSRYGRIDATFSPPRRHHLTVKEELPPVIKKARGRFLHYLRGPTGSRVVVFEEERMARQQARYDQRTATNHEDRRGVKMGSQRPVPLCHVGPQPLCHHRGDGRQAPPSP